MIAEIITIGDELLIGQTVDTNSTWMAQQLNHMGIGVRQIVTISDQQDAIRNAVDEAFRYADLVLMTGGLGPTKDDITKKTLTEYFDTKLVMNEEILQWITDRFAERGIPLLDTNVSQAEVPEDCTIIRNFRGTASGMWFDHEGKVLVAMPGVPHEMKKMISDFILPKVQEQFDIGNIVNRTVMTVGIGESLLAEKIKAWEDELHAENIGLAYLPSPFVVKLRLTSRGGSVELLNEKIEKLLQIVPEVIYGYDNETLEAVVGNLLVEREETLAVAESCTGGLISRMITSIPGASRYYQGSVTAYQASVKEKVLGVDPKVIAAKTVYCAEVAEQMATGVSQLHQATYGIGISGVAGPGPDGDTPAGRIYIAVAKGSKVLVSKELNFGDSRERNILKASRLALDFLRRQLLE